MGEIIEDVARLGARLIIQTAVEAEVDVLLGRALTGPGLYTALVIEPPADTGVDE